MKLYPNIIQEETKEHFKIWKIIYWEKYKIMKHIWKFQSMLFKEDKHQKIHKNFIFPITGQASFWNIPQFPLPEIFHAFWRR